MSQPSTSGANGGDGKPAQPAADAGPAASTRRDGVQIAADSRLRMVVYVSLFAFAVLAGYGFFLIVRLTGDIAQMSRQMEGMSPNVQKNMDRIALQLEAVAPSVQKGMDQVSVEMQQMSRATRYMGWATAQLQRDMWLLTHNVSAPLSFFNGFMPWGGSGGMNSSALPPPSDLGPYPPPAMPDGRVYPPPAPWWPSAPASNLRPAPVRAAPGFEGPYGTP